MSSSFPHLSSKASWNFPSVLAFFRVTESSSLTLSRRSWKLWNFLLQIHTETCRLSQRELNMKTPFTKRVVVTQHRSFKKKNNYCYFKLPALLLKGSSSCNYMNINTSASLRLCNKQLMHLSRHAWWFPLFSSATALWFSLCTRSWKPFYTPTITSRQRLKGSHYQHVNMMSPFPPHSSITNNRLGTRAKARQHRKNTWDILSGA